MLEECQDLTIVEANSQQAQEEQSEGIEMIVFVVTKQYNFAYKKRKMTSMNDLKLPPINSKSESMRLPNDNELLLQNDQAGNTQQKNLKIWEKKTASCRSKLKRFDNYQTAIDDKYVPINSFNQKQKKLIESALDIIQMRKKNKDLVGKNQTIVEILEQKKEMFLVTMTHGIIEKEIEHLTSQTQERAKALMESNQILERDKEDFEQYYQKYKAETKKIQEQFEKQVQKRLAKQQQIKSRQITVNSLRTLKVRNQQSIASSLRYKTFLNQLPPTDWIDQQSAKKQKRLKEVKERLKAQWTLSLSTTSKKSNASSTSVDEFQKYFQRLVESGENEQIEEIINDEEMYFKQPSQLIEYFNNLQENNLFNIQNSHLAEQKYLQLKVRSEEKKNELQSAFEFHKEQKRQLEKQLLDLDNNLKQLKKKKEQNSLLDEKDNKDIKATITQLYDELKKLTGTGKDNPFLPDMESKNSQSLALLSAIEICMERLWEKLIQCYTENPALVKSIRITIEKQKAKEKRDEATNFNKLEEEKRKNRNNQKKEPIQRLVGRIDMKRSPPQERVVVKKIETSDKDVDDDRKYLVQ